MRSTTSQHMSELQKNPKNIRNICILAHVDHGKTTIADALVASNGIISPRLAGKLRYMDSREDEQIRGITMKSSAISLHFKKETDEYLINLIDSPGHVDFSSEVSTAVQLCDGAIVVVDVVEGVCPQTHAVLRQAWLEDIRPCLVLNKIDRLITELKFSPLEAHIHLQQILEQVNAITGSLFSSQVMEKTSSSTSSKTNSSSPLMDCVTDKSAVSIDDWSSGLEETDDSHIYFSPDLGNVVFASAIDGWGFGISDFAAMLSAKLGIKTGALQKTLWGDFYLHSKTKRIFKGAQAKSKKPLFVQFVLENLWAVYDAVMVRRDKLRTEQIVKSLNLKISARDSRYTDPRVYLQAIFGQWLPLSKSLLSMVVNKLPSPLDMSEERVEKLMCSGMRTFESLPQTTQQLKKDFLACTSSEESPVIVFISKMFAVEEQALPHNRRRPLTQEEITQRREQARKHHTEMLASASENGTPLGNTECVKNEVKIGASTGVDKKPEASTGEPTPKNHFMAFARVFSGVVRKGQRLYVLGPRHEPAEVEGEELQGELGRGMTVSDKVQEKRNEGLSVARSIDRGTNQHAALFTVDDLYLLMGRELEAMESVPAGSILGIGGLENYVLKSATISSTLACPPFMALQLEARPIVRVAVEPVSPSDMPLLARGIRLLNQADPCVETLVQETGEHVIIAAGEVHLQRCVDDLKQRYARVELNVSSPIVPFRETVVVPPKTDMVNEAIVVDTSQQQNPKQQLREWSEDDGVKNTNPRERGLVEVTTANKQFRLLIRAAPLPPEVSTLLDKKADLLKALAALSGTSAGERRNVQSRMKESTLEGLQEFYRELSEAFSEAGSEWEGAVDCVMAFGPRRTGPNILLNRVAEYNRPSVWQGLHEESLDKRYRMFDNSVVSGFQLATLAGPLCEEPMMGVGIVIEEWSMRRHESEVENEYGQVKAKDGAGGTFDSNTHLGNKEDENTTRVVTRTTKKLEISDDFCCAELEENSRDKIGSSEMKHVLVNSVESLNKTESAEIIACKDSKEKEQRTCLSKPSEIAPRCRDDFTSESGLKESRSKIENEDDSLSGGDSDLRKVCKKVEKMISSEESKNTERPLECLQRNKDCSIAENNRIARNTASELELEDNDLTRMTKGKGRDFPCESKENPVQAADSVTVGAKDISTDGGRAKTESYGPLSGQIMAAVKEGCRRAFALQPMRLMAAMYTCQIQATSDVLGKMYAVVYKREGRVMSEEMREGSDVFDVTAVLPVAESFGFAEEIRKRTSGLAIPQLVFSHWEVVDIDPFWVPTTEEEYLHFGDKADSDNQARKYMNSVRRRKGLYVEEKTVEHAEKQRTLKK